MERSRQELLAKAAKLQALTESSNVHEAALAASKLQELLFAYSLELSELDAKAGRKARYGSVIFDITNGGPASIVNWKRGLLNVVCIHNFCQCVSMIRDDKFRKITGYSKEECTVIGEEHSIEVVRHMYAYLLVSILRLAERDWKTSRSAQLGHSKIRWLNAFYEGAVSKIYDRLRAQRSADLAKETGSALVVVKDQELKEAVEVVFPETRAVARSKPSSADGFKQGRKAANEIGLDPHLRSGRERAIAG